MVEVMLGTEWNRTETWQGPLNSPKACTSAAEMRGYLTTSEVGFHHRKQRFPNVPVPSGANQAVLSPFTEYNKDRMMGEFIHESVHPAE